MRALGAILGALAGGVIGYFAAFVAVYPILVAIEGRDMNGGIAMGVAVGVGPVMAIGGAVLFLILILRLTRPKQQNAKEKDLQEGEATASVAEGLSDEQAEFEAAFRPPAGATRTGGDPQAMIAAAVVIAIVIAGVMWLNG